ncbi:hypothetical protein J7L87_04535 [bacterium]|nr:hypothetical protein [bacterium]
MIKIEIDVAVSIYLSLSIIILLFWIVFERKSRARIKRKKEDFLWTCPICFYTYIDSKSESISRCPRCKTLHRRGEKL